MDKRPTNLQNGFQSQFWNFAKCQLKFAQWLIFLATSIFVLRITLICFPFFAGDMALKIFQVTRNVCKKYTAMKKSKQNCFDPWQRICFSFFSQILTVCWPWPSSSPVVKYRTPGDWNTDCLHSLPPVLCILRKVILLASWWKIYCIKRICNS